jgi:protein required for attachment to host cells
MPDTNPTWYVLADGKQVRILQHDGHSMTQIQGFDAEGHGDSAHDADTSVSHIQAPGTDPHEQAKQRFARHVAKHLNEAVEHKTVKHFHVAAPAHMLHDIVTHLNKPAEAALLSKQSKDLVHIAPSDVLTHFAA